MFPSHPFCLRAVQFGYHKYCMCYMYYAEFLPVPSVLAPSLGDTAPTPLLVCGFEPLLGPPYPANKGI